MRPRLDILAVLTGAAVLLAGTVASAELGSLPFRREVPPDLPAVVLSPSALLPETESPGAVATRSIPGTRIAGDDASLSARPLSPSPVGTPGLASTFAPGTRSLIGGSEDATPGGGRAAARRAGAAPPEGAGGSGGAGTGRTGSTTGRPSAGRGGTPPARSATGSARSSSPTRPHSGAVAVTSPQPPVDREVVSPPVQERRDAVRSQDPGHPTQVVSAPGAQPDAAGDPKPAASSRPSTGATPRPLAEPSSGDK